MFGLVRTLLGRMRYRRRWSVIAAAAEAAADSAIAEANRGGRGRRARTGESPSRRFAALAADADGRAAARPDGWLRRSR